MTGFLMKRYFLDILHIQLTRKAKKNGVNRKQTTTTIDYKVSRWFIIVVNFRVKKRKRQSRPCGISNKFLTCV